MDAGLGLGEQGEDADRMIADCGGERRRLQVASDPRPCGVTVVMPMLLVIMVMVVVVVLANDEAAAGQHMVPVGNEGRRQRLTPRRQP